MTDPYEQVADFMLSTMTGQSIGMTRDQLLAHLRDRFPDPQALRRTVAAVVARSPLTMAQLNLDLPDSDSIDLH